MSGTYGGRWFQGRPLPAASPAPATGGLAYWLQGAPVKVLTGGATPPASGRRPRLLFSAF